MNQPDLCPACGAPNDCALADPRTADCAVLLMSSHASEEDIEAGYAAGADDYLAKPFRPSQLLDRVTRLLETRRSA